MALEEWRSCWRNRSGKHTCWSCSRTRWKRLGHSFGQLHHRYGHVGRINSDASINWFKLTSNVGQTAGLIHLTFDKNPSRFWLLGSSTVDASGPNAVFTVTIDPSTKGSSTRPRIAIHWRSWRHPEVLGGTGVGWSGDEVCLGNWGWWRGSCGAQTEVCPKLRRRLDGQ